MKKVLVFILALMTISFVFAGCNPAPSDDAQKTVDVSESVSADTSVPAAESPASGNAPALSTGTAAESYSAYVNAKTAVITKLSEGLSSNEQTAFASMTMLGVTMADLVMLPAGFFGAGEESVNAGLSLFGYIDIKYTENGNSYSVSYTDNQGDSYVFSGTYDAAADALVCTAQKNGKDYFFSEYRRTSYGYVSQYYFINDDGTTGLYQFTLSGADGALGYSTTQTSQPAALTGSESADFPTALPEWYSITGSAIKGVMSDGTEVNFEYVPKPSE